MMRKNQHTFYILAACTVLLSGCARVLEEDLEEQMPTFRSKYICFVAASGDIATKSSPADAPVSFMTEEDWPVGTPTTKGNPTTAFSGNASITGYLYSGDWAGTETPWATLYDKSFSFNGSVLNAVADPVPWVKAQSVNPKLRVYAYAPADFAATMSSSSAPGAPTLTYEVPSDVGDQKDLIVATGDALCADKTSVPLTFSHALTAVKFNVDFPCTVKRIVVSGVYDSGVYTIGGAWSGQAFSSTEPYPSYTIDFGEGISCNKGSSVTDGANTLMMIPQTVPEGAQVVMTYNEGGDDQTLTASIAGGEWAAGKRITYTLSKETPNYIYFDLALGNVTITFSSGSYRYSGKVYTYNGTTAATVSGVHSPSNQYYVYQSNSSNKTTTGWSEGLNSTMTVPSYSVPKTSDGGVSWGTSGDKSWSEYVTNNPDCDGVITNWTKAMTAVGRSSSPYYIQINGNNTTIMDCDVDMIIDNVWSSYYTTANGRYVGGFMISPMGADRFGKRYDHVTLKLKGDNRFHNVMYFGHPASQTDSHAAWLKVTSEQGDGSSKGSLTVSPPNTTSPLGYYNSVFGGADDDGCPPQYGMNFYGGTIYVSTNSASDEWCTSVLGGGTNQYAELTFDGAVVTAVGYSASAAIGGGAGRLDKGGDGHITIRSGKVYAYQFGIRSLSAINNTWYVPAEPARYLPAGTAMATVAIGGGSSFTNYGNDAIINIYGGEVYAQSMGGSALGGGTSQFSDGGSATVNIYGGTVVAKSISGYGVQHQWFDAGGSVGGGRGGIGFTQDPNETSSIGYGGSATINVYGGILQTGSVGGGSTLCTAGNITIGTATINISGGDVQGQFIMAAGASTPPTFTMTGGRINNGGLLEVNGYNKVKSNGGAVYIEDGDFTMTGGEIRNASAVNGGVVYMTNGSFSLEGGSILNSTASGSGGAVYIAGTSNPTFEMSGGEISGCNADSDGGAVYLEGGSVTIDNGTIRRNKALGGSGGGICINKGSFTMSDGAINGNYADLNGGGVYISSVDTDVTATVSGGTITENTSEKWGGGLCILPGGSSAAIVTLGATGRDEYTGLLTNPDISGNRSKFAGGGVYTAGANAHITINSGKINGNQVTAYVANENVANEGGMVTLLDGDVTHQVVTFHANGEAVSATAYFGTELEGTGPTTKIQKIVTSTNSKLVAPTVYYCAGFHFNGWNSRPDGLGETYTNGQVMNITENVDLYIQWEID